MSNIKKTKLPLLSATNELFMDEGEQLIACPICGEHFTHFGNNPKILPTDTYLSEHRGGGYIIPMWCESSHSWDLVISHHKGNSYITTQNLRVETIDEREERINNSSN